MGLHGKVAIVTGGARGIGGAAAIELAREGVRVVVADLRASDAVRTVAEITRAGGEAVSVPVDVTDESSVAAMVASAIERWGSIDILVHAAGILKGAALTVDELPTDVFDEVISVNLRGAFLCSKHVAAHMRSRQSGVMLLIASGAGVRGGSSSVAYGSSKGGVHGLSLVLAPQLEPHGIRVHGICPGSIATELKLDNVADMARSRGEDPVAARRQAAVELGDPAGVAHVLTFLASDAADYVRGSIFTR
ncbi:MAG: SDR family NAD(P)-dependent oxidoreductase [Chloroflexota bacterium]|nr:MAG: SDR family NAD(P)-dependent oxidoreductase [Chloroflexota bacterium]